MDFVPLPFPTGLRLLRVCAAPAPRPAHGGGVRAGARGGRRDGAHVLPEGNPGEWAILLQWPRCLLQNIY